MFLFLLFLFSSVILLDNSSGSSLMFNHHSIISLTQHRFSVSLKLCSVFYINIQQCSFNRGFFTFQVRECSFKHFKGVYLGNTDMCLNTNVLITIFFLLLITIFSFFISALN